MQRNAKPVALYFKTVPNNSRSGDAIFATCRTTVATWIALIVVEFAFPDANFATIYALKAHATAVQQSLAVIAAMSTSAVPKSALNATIF